MTQEDLAGGVIALVCTDHEGRYPLRVRGIDIAAGLARSGHEARLLMQACKVQGSPFLLYACRKET